MRDRACLENLFEGLLCQIRGICAGQSEGEPLTELMDSIGGMLTVLGTEQNTPPAKF